jgi:quercetin dioxygenase-like cupin family protein
MMSSLLTKPHMLKPDEGQRLNSGAALVFVKASTQQTGGAFNLLEIVGPAGFATSLHIHYAEDVALFVLDGSLTVYWGDQKEQATRGSYFFQPRGTPYGFRVTGDSPARLLLLTIPAGFDRLVEEHGPMANEIERSAAAARHKIEVLGPLAD